MSRAYYRKRSEATEQERVMNWATFYAKDFPELALLHHIPNGGSRNQLEAANLKRQGVKAGCRTYACQYPETANTGCMWK